MKSRLGVLVALAALGSSMLTLVGVNSANAAPAFAARASQSNPIIGETILIAGVVPPAKRPVRLLVYNKGKWIAVAVSKTTTGGRYSFAVKATSTPRAYRAFAPKVKKKKKRKKAPARFSNVVRIVGVKPSLALGIAAAPVGQLSSGETGVTPGVATFRPARPGAAVSVQQLVSGTWKTVVSGGRQNSAGAFRFNVRAGTSAAPGTFRAVTATGRGVATQVSPAVRPTFLDRSFNDDFGGTELSDQWATRAQPAFGQRMCAQPDPSQVTVANGAAVLHVKKVATPAGKNCPYGFWHNAMIGTANASNPFTQTNGVFAARVKFQAAPGMHGSFWLQGPSTTGAEIDAAEYFGDGRTDGGLSSFVHYTRADKSTATSGGIHDARSILGAGRTPSNSWHVYSVEWNKSGYIFRMDGIPVFSTNKPFVATAAEGMILSLLTSDWELSRLKSPASTMQVDWVRAWGS